MSQDGLAPNEVHKEIPDFVKFQKVEISLFAGVMEITRVPAKNANFAFCRNKANFHYSRKKVKSDFFKICQSPFARMCTHILRSCSPFNNSWPSAPSYDSHYLNFRGS